MIIKIDIANKRPTVDGTPVVVCGNSGYTIDFEFDEEWISAGLKTARFVYVQDGEVKHKDVAFMSEPVPVPIMTNVREFRVGVYANELQTTTPAVIPCEKSILCGTGENEAEPLTPSQYDQVMALLNQEGVAYLAGSKQDKLGWLTRSDLEAMWAGSYVSEDDEDDDDLTVEVVENEYGETYIITASKVQIGENAAGGETITTEG